jgi:hypothetical protein
MTISPSNPSLETNFTARQAQSTAKIRQTVIKKIRAKWGQFSEHDLSSLNNLDEALSHSPSIGAFWAISVRLPEMQIIDFARVSRRTPGAVDK